MSQRHRHEYAADLPHGLSGVFGDPTEEFPHTSGGMRRARPRSTRFRAGPRFEGRNNAGSSHTPFHLACRTRTIWQY